MLFRSPMEFEVRIGEKTVGKLLPEKTGQKEVTLTTPAGGIGAKTAVEEVVTELSGEIELPAGRQEILLIHHNIVDGKLDKVGIGQ